MTTPPIGYINIANIACGAPIERCFSPVKTAWHTMPVFTAEPSNAKVEFTLTLFDDAGTRRKEALLNRLELMFDDERNPLPPEYFALAETLPYGSRVKVIFEVL